MLLVTINHIPGKEFEVLGMVKGCVVQSKNFGKDFMAGMKTLVGGEIKGYTEMLVEARQIATKRMVDEAMALNADAVVGVTYGSSAVMQGAAEVIADGTAVKFKSAMNRKRRHTIQTDRLFLRAIQDIDEEALLQILTHPRVYATFMVPDLQSREEARGMFNRIKSLSEAEDRFVYGVYFEE